MSTYVDQYALSTLGNFRQQVASAIVSTAEVVVGEPGATTNHANRLALAQDVLVNHDTWAQRMALAVIEANTSIANTAPNGPAQDADVFSAVSSIWNVYADAHAAGV